MALFTVGHGTRSTAELAAVVRAFGVERVVDVRRYPRSRRQPHLDREALAQALPTLGVAFEWWGDELGGRRRPAAASRHGAWRNDSFRAYADHMDTEAFRQAFHRLLAGLGSSPPTAIMCAETLWWRCHRRLIADAAVLAGTEVDHILDQRQVAPHRLHPSVRADGQGRPVYDVGAQLTMEQPPW
ncbi:MAG: DUF488 domain-containing protein [Actinomycetota bacterium]|nr:DUF488 domain-containing protein [Actinomycetota bacterium]